MITESELKRLIETLFIRSDKLWHFKVAEVSEFSRQAIEIAREIQSENVAQAI